MTTTIAQPGRNSKVTGLRYQAPRYTASLPASLRRLPGGKKDYSALSDDELVSCTRQGEREAFGELVKRYQTKVNSLALKLTKNENDAQEVVQDVFLNAYAKLDSFKGTAAFSSWLYRVAANGALMLLRSRKRDTHENWEDAISRVDTLVGVPADWSVQADQVMARKQLGTMLSKEFAMLPERYRVILMMREVEGMSNREIATHLTISVAAVKSRLHRARLMLRKRLTGAPEKEWLQA
jgi:RNA polymerase sigma-70 factor (ECF subfamily)